MRSYGNAGACLIKYVISHSVCLVFLAFKILDKMSCAFRQNGPILGSFMVDMLIFPVILFYCVCFGLVSPYVG